MDHIGNQLTWTGDAGDNVSFAESADFKDKSTTKGTIEYTYNKNGAMYSDLNKGITSIQYNSLNLPCQMVINSSSVKAKNY
ncbi:MAG: type IV secretion protein Rhs, partial [Bacteroides xylanisolvens]